MLISQMTQGYILLFSVFLFSIFRLKYLMLFFQQNEYRTKWYLKYIFKDLRLIDKKLTISLIILYFLAHFNNLIIWGLLVLLDVFAIIEHNYLKKAKKKLAITSRVKRIFAFTLCLVLLFMVGVFNITCSVMIITILTIQALPFLLVLGNILLMPNEKKIQAKFKQEAVDKLAKLQPIVVGITGSYGKTSTKHILSHILSGNLPVLFTPGSVNTEMGITRIVREKLTEEHKYFVVEMGAYFKGSIEKLCKFVNPQHGIITSIGECHYEHFKTQEIIASTKFELGEWVSKNNGLLIINTDQIKNEFIPVGMSLIKVGQGNDNYISNLNQTTKGLSFDFHTNNEVYNVETPIFGKHQASNIALAIEMALTLGMSMNTILATLKTLPQTNHRLEVLYKDNGVIMIDDAYNSNKEGFKSALDLLGTLKKTRSILVTPGMVELGDKNDESHYEVGKIAGQQADIAIIVGSDRIPTFIKGFNETKKETSTLIEVKSFQEAQEWMNTNLKNDDVVLLENDLTDIYETRRVL